VARKSKKDSSLNNEYRDESVYLFLALSMPFFGIFFVNFILYLLRQVFQKFNPMNFLKKVILINNEKGIKKIPSLFSSH